MSEEDPGTKTIKVPVQELGATVQVPPTPVSVIGGSEGLAPKTTIVVTPDDHPNLLLTVVPPIMAIIVRFLNTYFTTLVGLLAAAMTTSAITAPDFYHLVLKCGGLSVAGAGFGLLKDLVTVFGRLEGKYPLLTGSI